MKQMESIVKIPLYEYHNLVDQLEKDDSPEKKIEELKEKEHTIHIQNLISENNLRRQSDILENQKQLLKDKLSTKEAENLDLKDKAKKLKETNEALKYEIICLKQDVDDLKTQNRESKLKLTTKIESYMNRGFWKRLFNKEPKVYSEFYF